MNKIGIYIVFAALIIAAAILVATRSNNLVANVPDDGDPPYVASAPVTNDTQLTQPVAQNMPVTMVALYEFMGSTLVLNSDGKGVVSGSCFGEKGSSFAWQDTGPTIELTNWTWSETDDGKGTCTKLEDNEIDLVWLEHGKPFHAQFWGKRLK